MKTIPMIFNTEMVKALLDGRKTVTRRLIKDQSIVWNYSGEVVADDKYSNLNSGDLIDVFRDSGHATPIATIEVIHVDIERVQDITEEQAKAEGVRYHWLYDEWGGVERHPESIGKQPFYRWYEKATDAFKNLWSSIYSNWNENPYVWVIEFEVIHKNVDEVD